LTQLAPLVDHLCWWASSYQKACENFGLIFNITNVQKSGEDSRDRRCSKNT